MRKRTLAMLIALVLGSVGFAAVAHASIIPTLSGSDGLGSFSYSLTLDPLSTAVTNTSFTTFNGVQGLVGANVGTNTDWIESDAGANVTFTYTGPGKDAGSSGFTWPGFTLLSTFPNLASGPNIFYNASDVNTATGFTQTNTGYVQGPVATPEPGTMLLVGTGLVGLGWWRRSRVKNTI